MLEVTVATADSRRCEDNGGARTYLSQPLEGMTGEGIANDFMSAVVLPNANEHIRNFWKEFATQDGNIETMVKGWDASPSARNSVLERRQFVELLYQLRKTIIAFEGTRQTAGEAADLIAGTWNDWRAKHMSRDAFIQQFQAEAETLKKSQGITRYSAVLQAASSMRNRLDDLQGAAGFRDPIDDMTQMWIWDSWIRQKAADAEVQKLKSMPDGVAYLNNYLLARKTTLKCVAARLDAAKGKTTAQAAPMITLDLALYRRPHIFGALASGKAVEINDESMGYLSGFLELYLPNCQWPGTADQLLSVTQFYQATVQRALTYASNITTVAQNSVLYGAAASDGKSDFERFRDAYRCRGKVAENFTGGLVKTVQVTGSAEKKESPFMWSCIRSKLTEKQCACLVELGRGADPDIENTFYDRRTTIKNLVGKNLFLGVQVSAQCGIADY
jgi:hypothetical protein